MVDSSRLSHSVIKGNKLIIKRLNETDLENFECISDNGHFKMNKKLSLNLLNEIRLNDSAIRLLQEKKMNKTAKYFIRLPDLNIETNHFLNNQIELKCHISTGKFQFQKLEYKNNLLLIFINLNLIRRLKLKTRKI